MIAVHVEMVRRFVEQQHVGSGNQRSGQQHSPFHSGREGFDRHVERQLHIGQQLPSALLDLPDGVRLGRSGAAHHDVEHTPGEILRNFLRQERHRRACGQLNFAAIGLHIAFQDSQERRFARAIAPQQANSLAGFDLKRNIVQQQRTSKSDAKFIDGDQGHSEINRS